MRRQELQEMDELKIFVAILYICTDYSYLTHREHGSLVTLQSIIVSSFSFVIYLYLLYNVMLVIPKFIIISVIKVLCN